MHQDLQESAFLKEVEKRIQQLTDEFDLSYAFVIGALELIIHQIKMQHYESEED